MHEASSPVTDVRLAMDRLVFTTPSRYDKIKGLVTQSVGLRQHGDPPVEPPRGFEPRTYALRVRCSTPELRRPARLSPERLPGRLESA